MGVKVGIDLGTTFSAVAVINEKTGQPNIVPNTAGERITPSVIQFTENGDIIVGTEAKDAYEFGEYGCTSVFKRCMGNDEPYCTFYGKSYSSEELSAILLRYLKEEAEAVLHQTIDEAVVTVPAYFYHKERGATLRAAKRAGLNVRQLINEPTAAAMSYGVNHWRENANILVYDLGGGTFDVTLVEMKKNGQMISKQTKGNHILGGKDWDSSLSSLIINKIESEIAYYKQDHPEIESIVAQSAESIKKQLTTKNTAQISLYLPEYGTYKTEISIDDFNSVTVDLLNETGTLCRDVLQEAGLTWENLTDILLVGGSTRMRQVSDYLYKLSGNRHKPLTQVNPDEAVALGAAIQVHLPLPKYIVLSSAPSDDKDLKTANYQFRKTKAKPKSYLPGKIGKETALPSALSIVQRDVVAHAMGVIAVNQEGTAYINKTIVPANQTIPVKYAESFNYYTSSYEENEVEIYVLQGEKPPLESEIIGKYVVSGITHNPNENPTIIKIQYSYDINGMIHVQARQGNGKSDLPIREEGIPDDMSKYGRPIDESEKPKKLGDLYVVMALDVSGSMSGKPLKNASDAMCNFIDMLSDYPGKVEIGVLAVSDRTCCVQALTTNMEKCKKETQSITCGLTGYCNAADPFDEIKNMLHGKKGKKIGIVLADGVWENQYDAVLRAKKCHKSEIDIIGIGFGSADEQFLKDISSGDIDSMMVARSGELTKSFGKIAQEIGGSGKKHSRFDTKQKTETWQAPGE